MFESVALQAAPDAEQPLEFVEEPAPTLSERARHTLMQLVTVLVEEGVLDREELIEALARLTVGEGVADQ
jgi:hypothetical protein